MSATPSREETLLERALSFDSTQARDAFLDTACADDIALRSRVESLLRAHNAAGRFLEPKVCASGANPASLSLTQIGRYTILEKIAEGGCGTVYLAEQREPVKRRVALKVIKAGMDTQSVIARFEAEQQALALMDHPNIAKVFDAGSTETGRPYFVMELVDGVKITDYCDQKNLSITDRLDLFLQVCDAVQHAHQKGIIHRDLKPSNILVASQSGGARLLPSHSDARPKVIDFGIAKSLSVPLTDATIHTGSHQFLGTPAYMSPEQADLSPDIDTRTDIYSLGVLLYELLTGRPPFDNQELLTAGIDEMRRIIREVEPKRPSALVGTRSIASQVPQLVIGNGPSAIDSDLDWIVMQCLEKDRSRRYPTANTLVADIRRYLQSEPITARPASAAYRFAKFACRNKLQLTAAAVVLTALISAAVISRWQTIRARQAETVAKQHAVIATEQTKKAAQEAENASGVKQFLIENLLGVDCCGETPDGDALTFEATEALIRKVAKRLEGKFKDQPGTEIELRMALCRGFMAKNDFASAAVQAEKALEINTRLFGPAGTNVLDPLRWLANAKFQLGQKDESLALASNMLRIARMSTNAQTSVGAAALAGFGGLLFWNQQPEAAIPYLTEAMPVLKSSLGSTNPMYKTWFSKLANATAFVGRTNEAEALWHELRDQCEIDHGPDAIITLQHRFTLARFLVFQNRAHEAEGLPVLEQVLPLYQAKIGASNYLTIQIQFALGYAYAQVNMTDKATATYRDLYSKLAILRSHPERTRFCRDMEEFFRRHSLNSDAEAVRKILETKEGRSP